MLIAQISDFHLKPEGVLAYRVAETASALRRAVEHINHLQPMPDAVLITGDLVDEGAFESYSPEGNPRVAESPFLHGSGEP